MKLYKYAGPGLVKKALKRKGLAYLKFDYPKNYNDPLELFQTVRGEEDDPRVIAYYAEILGEIPQLPTTCFSRRPDIIPMWAHYAKEHAGFVIEFDERALCNTIPIGYIENVHYADEPGATDWGAIRYAATTLKPRHTYHIQSLAFRHAYLTKNKCWEYEQERRLIIDKQNFASERAPMLLKIPPNCVTALISGIHSTEEQLTYLRDAAKRFQCPHYKMRIGRSSPIPYFLDEKGFSLSFDGSQISRADNTCGSCGEPLSDTGMQPCAWCRITESDKGDAHINNPFTMIDDLGLREEFGYGFKLQGIRPVGYSVTEHAEPKTAPTQNPALPPPTL